MERLINESASSTTVSELCAEYRANNQITKDEYELYHVKRGLRNRDAIPFPRTVGNCDL